MSPAAGKFLTRIYRKLYKHFGPQHWWPAETLFEVMVGAILTQNTNWGNVGKAIRNLKNSHCLSPQALQNIPIKKLAQFIKPSGYFNIKAQRLKNFIQFLFAEYQGDLKKMTKDPLRTLRKKVLSVNGIGPETADSILLYALGKPVFVVDAYTRRIFYRHSLIPRDSEYHLIQDLFMTTLPRDLQLFNEYHALIVKLGKDFCKKKPLCEICPLNNIHYSLVFKCGVCHRVLFKDSQRRINQGLPPQTKPLSQKNSPSSTYLCQYCFDQNEKK